MADKVQQCLGRLYVDGLAKALKCHPRAPLYGDAFGLLPGSGTEAAVQFAPTDAVVVGTPSGWLAARLAAYSVAVAVVASAASAAVPLGYVDDYHTAQR